MDADTEAITYEPIVRDDNGGDDQIDTNSAVDDDDSGSDCPPPPIDIPQPEPRQLRRSRSAQPYDASSSCSSASPLTSVATATPSRSNSARSASDLRSDRELISQVISSDNNPDELEMLDLSTVAKKTRKTLKSLRALTSFVNLVQLDVSNNAIDSVDGVETFAQLQVLAMSRNHLKRIGSPLVALTSLRHLDLSGNFIAHIPRAIVALAQLETLRLAGNNLTVLKDVDALSALANLHDCSFAANPFCKLPTYKDYVVCKLPSLETLDDTAITAVVRDRSRRRFSDALFCKDARLREVGIAHEHEQSKLRDAHSALEAENLRLKGELQVKSKLLQNKSKEWSSATGQLLQLQQEIAMLNLDRRGCASPLTASYSSDTNSLARSASSFSVSSLSAPQLSDSRASVSSPGSMCASPRNAVTSLTRDVSDYRRFDTDSTVGAMRADDLDFELRQPLHSPSPTRNSVVPSAAGSPTLNAHHCYTPSASSHDLALSEQAGADATTHRPLVLDLGVVVDSPGRDGMCSHSKWLIDSACSPLRRSAASSPDKPTTTVGATSTHSHKQPSPDQHHDDQYVRGRSAALQPSSVAASSLPRRSKSFGAVRQAFSDLSPERRDAALSLMTESAAVDLAEDDAVRNDLRSSRSARFPTFEDDVACPAYEDDDAVGRYDELRQHVRHTRSPSRGDHSPHTSPLRSPAQRLWRRQHAEFRDETFGRQRCSPSRSPGRSPSRSPLKVSTAPSAAPSAVLSPVEKDRLTQQIQALQSCKQSLVTEIANEEQLLHALKHEAAGYAGQIDQLELDIQVALQYDHETAAAAAASGISSLTDTGASSPQRTHTSSRQREAESLRAKLEVCRSKLRFAEDTEREIELTMVRTTKRVLRADVQQHAPFDKEIFALTHRLQHVIVQKEEIHHEMRRLMDRMHERSGGTEPSLSPSRRASSRGGYERQTVEAMLDEEAQRQRLSAELQHSVAVARQRVDELQRRYDDVMDRVRVKENRIASFVDELKDVEKELALIGQRPPSAQPFEMRRVRQRSASLDFHPSVPVSAPSQATVDAIELELAEALKAIKSGRIDLAGATTALVTTTGDSVERDTRIGRCDAQQGSKSTGAVVEARSSSSSASTSVAPGTAGTVTSATATDSVQSTPSHALQLNELLTAEVLDAIKKDIYERLSKQLAAVAGPTPPAAVDTTCGGPATRERSETQDHRDLHDAIAGALESQMQLALESFHKQRDSASEQLKKQQQLSDKQQRVAASSSPSKRHTRTNDPTPVRAMRQQQQQAGADDPSNDDVACDQLDDFVPVDASYAPKYRFVKPNATLSGPPSPAGTTAKSARATGVQRILKACERLEVASTECRVDPVSAIEVDALGTKRSCLRVLLMGARDLPTTHLRTKNLDPYVSVEIVYPDHLASSSSSKAAYDPAAITRFRSRTVKKSVYPVWDEEFEFAPVQSLKGVLHVRVLNDRKLSREQLVGEVRIPLRSLVSQKKAVAWYPLRWAVPATAGTTARKTTTTTVLRTSGGSVRLQLQLSYSRIEKCKRAVDELVTKFFHEHNQLPPFIEATAGGSERFSSDVRTSSSNNSSAQQNQDQHESDEQDGVQSSRRFAARDDAAALDELHRYQYLQQQQVGGSDVPEVESPGKDAESPLPTFDTWRVEQQQQHQRIREAAPSSSRYDETSPQRLAVDVMTAAHAFDSSSHAAYHCGVGAGGASSSTAHRLSSDRSRQLWATPAAHASQSSVTTARPIAVHPSAHTANDRVLTYPSYATMATTLSSAQHRQQYAVRHEQRASYRTLPSDPQSFAVSFTAGSTSRSATPSGVAAGLRATMPASTAASLMRTHSGGDDDAGPMLRRTLRHTVGARASRVVHPTGRRRTTGAYPLPHAHHLEHQRPECFDDDSPYHPDFQFFDVMDLYGGNSGSSGGSNSDLFAAKRSKRKGIASLYTWQAGASGGGSRGDNRLFAGLDDANRKTDLRIFKSPGFARRQPSAGFPERYIGLDNQTCERLKRMFGRMDGAGSAVCSNSVTG